MPWTASINPQIQARWRRRVAAQQSSGLNQTAFARRQKYSVTSLGNWRRWFEHTDLNSPAFVELKTKVEAPQPAQQAVAAWQEFPSMILETPTHHQIHLRPGFDGPGLSRLICILEAM